MFGQRPAPTVLSSAQTNDPNELLRRIDQNTTMTFHWVRSGVIVTVILLIAIALGF